MRGAKRKARDVGTDYCLECLVKNFAYRVTKVEGAMLYSRTILKSFKRDVIGNKDRSYKGTAEV